MRFNSKLVLPCATSSWCTAGSASVANAPVGWEHLGKNLLALDLRVSRLIRSICPLRRWEVWGERDDIGHLRIYWEVPSPCHGVWQQMIQTKVFGQIYLSHLNHFTRPFFLRYPKLGYLRIRIRTAIWALSINTYGGIEIPVFQRYVAGMIERSVRIISIIKK